MNEMKEKIQYYTPGMFTRHMAQGAVPNMF